MIKKLVRQMLAAQIFSALTVSVCLLIDNIMISRFLGEEGMAAYSFSNPILLAIGAIGSLLAAGIQVACSRSLGRGSQEETNAGYSTAVILVAAISILFMVGVLVFRAPLAAIMGAGHDGSVNRQTQDYLAGFCIGAPGSMAALVLVPFMQMAGQSSLLIAAVLSMTLADITLDLLNVYMFHGGMFGMGLASSLSYYLALIVGCFYFLSRRCVFRFSWKLVSWKKTAELFRGGVPAGFNMAASVVFVFLMNHILKSAGGTPAIAAYTVISSLGNSANCITTGIGGVALTLSGIFYHEEDRTSLKQLMRLLARYSVALGAVVGVLLLVFAPQLVTIFIPRANDTQAMAILGMRLFAAGLIPCCVNNALKFTYQATERVLLSELISLLEGAVFPAAAAFLMSRIFGVTGAWLYFVIGEALTLMSLFIYIWRKTKRSPIEDGAYLLLRDDFGVTDDNLLEVDISSRQEVAAAAERAEAFCLEHGQSPKLSNHIALCVEEMASNTVSHGFNQEKKRNHLLLRVLHKPDAWILRFRDDCTAFDPVHYVPDASTDALGLKLVRGLARDVSYTYSLSMNNLTIKLPAEAPAAQEPPVPEKSTECAEKQ